MNKLSLSVSALALVLLVTLPGCCKRKKRSDVDRRSNIEQNIDLFASADGHDAFLADDLDADSDNLRTYFDFDEEAEELVPNDEANFYRNFDLEDDKNDSQHYAWANETEDELKSLYFGFNKYGLTEDQKNIMASNVEQLKLIMADAGSDMTPVIVAEGHTCQEGAPAYNVSLSEKRAKGIADMLIEAGFEKDSIKVVGRGSEVPMVLEGKTVDGTREDRAPNRRVELKVIYT